MKLLSLVFSFRNEEENLENLISRLNNSLANLTNWKSEYIFVNDDSSDKSEELLVKLQKNNPIKIINLSRKFGIGPGILAGLNEAKGDATVYMDSDLQDPPELIPKLIDKFEKGADVVHTKRTKRIDEGIIKLFLTSIAYKLISKSANIDLPLNAGDFKLLSKRAVKHINSLKEYNPYVRGLTVWVGFKQDFVEYVREGRSAGETKFKSTFSGGLRSGPITEFIRGMTSFSTGPLYIGILIGMIAIISSFLLILYVLYEKYLGSAVPGSAGIIIVICFFSGVILTTMGIIGIYIAKIFEQIQGRPRYIVKNILDLDEKNNK